MNNLKKYPRTYHLHWSPGLQNDDRMHENESFFDGKEVVATIKMDGENTSIYKNHVHARSLDSQYHPSRDWVKSFASQFQHEIPEGWRICGENLYAKHSIFYNNLPSYFLGFNIWDDKNFCLSWDETLEWFNLLGITPVESFYRGIWDASKIQEIFDEYNTETTEGYVVRISNEFHYDDFNICVAKWVRKGHVQTSNFWMNEQVIPNKLSKD